MADVAVLMTIMAVLMTVMPVLITIPHAILSPLNEYLSTQNVLCRTLMKNEWARIHYLQVSVRSTLIGIIRIMLDISIKLKKFS